MGTIDPNPFENLLAVQVYAPKSWVASAHLNGRAAAELFPLDGGVSTTVCTVEGFARHVAEKLYTLGVLSLEEFYDVPVRTDWKISYVLSWANRFGIEVKLCPILAIMPPVSAGATGAQRARSVFDSILEAVCPPLGMHSSLSGCRPMCVLTLEMTTCVMFCIMKALPFRNLLVSHAAILWVRCWKAKW